MADERSARLVRVVERAPETRSLFLAIPGGLAFRPGQFISCLLPVGDTRLVRPYSIASDPETPDELELLLDLVPGGAGSHYLFGLTPGATIRFTGPWGTFALDEAPAAETVFIAESTGIAPIRPMLRRAAASARQPLHLLHGTDHRLYADELASLPALRVAYVAPAALADEVARRWVDADDDRSRHFFVCGVGAIVPRLRDLLRGAGYARRAVQYEKW
jgi:ferredoxin-NADP reductase